jgi:hypothetical protein
VDEGIKADAVKKAVKAIGHWLERFDAVIIGPGLGRDELVHDTVVEVLRSFPPFFRVSIPLRPTWCPRSDKHIMKARHVSMRGCTIS